MRSSVLGLMAGIFIICWAVVQTSDDVNSYLNLLSLVIVFGGTLSAAIITHGFHKLYAIFKMFFKAFKTAKYNNVTVVNEIVDISKRMQNGESVEKLQELNVHPYVKDGLRLIYNKFSDDKIINISRTMLNERISFYEESVDRLEVLAKYPPAFGMMGTIIGLIAVLKEMGSDTGIESVGPNMAVALITTLYGIFIANYIIHPISDNLYARSQTDLKVRRIIAEGILLLNKKEDPIYVREVLLGYLLPNERMEFEKGNSKTETKVAA
ncbi:MAG: hypothetical protein HON90_01810 [Halobacteriovoraceae bacterium]|jgi:chemotaxis protein MotA|nr:hypothetical protein [Halobacteriovoraceae bacterium]